MLPRQREADKYKPKKPIVAYAPRVSRKKTAWLRKVWVFPDGTPMTENQVAARMFLASLKK